MSLYKTASWRKINDACMQFAATTNEPALPANYTRSRLPTTGGSVSTFWIDSLHPKNYTLTNTHTHAHAHAHTHANICRMRATHTNAAAASPSHTRLLCC